MDNSIIPTPSAPSPPEPAGEHPPAKRRSRRRWLLSIILFLVGLPLLVYALLPWLIPTDWLRNQIVAGIQTNFGRAASIPSIEISWSEGIIVRDITVDRLEEFGSGEFFQASRLQLDFRPLRFLLGRRLGTVRVDQPSLWIVADDNGRVNLTSLPSPPETTGFDLISITNANLHLINQVHDREGLISIPVISVASDADTGQFRFRAEGESAKTTGQPTFSLQLSFLPRSKQPATEDIAVIGSAELTWSDFDLASLPLPRFGRLDLQTTAAKTSGRAHLKLYSDGHIELFDCAASADDLHLQMVEFVELPQSDQPPVQPAEIHIPHAEFSLQGSYEFLSGQLAVHSLKGLFSGLEFSTSFQGRFSSTARAFLPSAASLTAKVQPSRLREQLPFLDELFRRRDLTVTGSSSLTVDFKQSERIDRVSFSLDALEMGVHVPNLLHKSAGLPCRIAFAAEIDHTTGLLTLAEPLQAELASGRFSLDMRLAQPLRMSSFLDLLTRPLEIAGPAVQQWPQAYLSSSLGIKQAEDFAAIFPTLAPALANTKLSGPLTLQFVQKPLPRQNDSSVAARADLQQSVEPSQVSRDALGKGRTQLRASISLPAQTSLELPPYFRKLPGTPLTLSLVGRLAQQRYRIEDLNISCQLAESTLSVADATFTLEPRSGSSPQPADLQPGSDGPAAPPLGGFWSSVSAMDLSARVTSIFAAGELRLENSANLPKAIAPLRGLQLAGDLSGRFDLRFAPADVLSLALALDAKDLACQIPLADGEETGSGSGTSILFKKTAGVPTELDMQLRVNVQQSDASTLQPPRGLGLSASALTDFPFQARIACKFADSSGSLRVDHEKSFYDFEVGLARLNLDDLSAHMPTLARIFEDYQLGGVTALTLNGRLGSDLLPKELHLEGDFTDIRCTIRASADESTDQPRFVVLQKEPGLPLSCRASLAVDGPDAKDRRKVLVKSAELRFATSELNLLDSALIISPAKRNTESILLPEYWLRDFPLRLEPFIRAEFTGNGQVVFDDDLFELLPALADIDRKWGLTGTLNYRFDFATDARQASLGTTLNSGPKGLKLGPADFKGMQQRLQVFLKPAAEGIALSGASLELSSLELNVLDEPLRASGSLNLQTSRLDVPDLFIAIGNSSAHCNARLQNIWSGPVGHINLYSPLLDQPTLADFGTRLVSSLRQQQVSANQDSGPSPSSTVAESTAAGVADATATDPGPAPPAADADAPPAAVPTGPPLAEMADRVLSLPPMDIDLQVQCDKFVFQDPVSSQQFNFEQVDLDSQITSSSLVAHFTTAMNGGRIDNKITISFSEPGLPLTYTYEALELLADENTAPMISGVFPDMTVTGTITESRTMATDILGGTKTKQFPREQGKNLLRDGVLIGPSAPWWVTHWFPKLSLTEYQFEIADNVFSRDPEDGSVSNDMVLVGKGKYNIYINGTTKADNTTDYTVGVDLSRFMTLQQRHNWRQFRVPLLSYTGQIADGKWASQTVKFVWLPQAAWNIFIKNNALRTLIERRRQAD